MKNLICKQQLKKHEAYFNYAMPEVCSWFSIHNDNGTDRPGANIT